MAGKQERRGRPGLGRVLVVDDEDDIRELLDMTLVRMGLDADCAASVAEARRFLAENSYQLCLTDMRLPDGDGLDLVRHIGEQCRDLPVAVITAHGSMDNAVQALKAGAFDYVAKPVSLEQLRALIRSVLNLPGQAGAGAEPAGRALLGESQAIEQARAMIGKTARSQAPVYIGGESGSGKELAARLIHEQGPRREQPFIAVNCGAIPENLMESEFFGYRKGAFTGAESDRDGFFQAAQGGTLFLDEIGHMEADIQAKLLHAIEHRAIRPVGGTQTRPMNVHVVAATNRDLPAAVESGEFRRDLYHRLRVVEIIVPPLRERREDVVLLANHFLAMHSAKFGLGRRRFTDDACRALQECDWRGNVRELSHLIESCVLQADSESIDRAQLPLLSDMRTPDVSLGLPHGRVINMDFEKGRPTLDEVEHAILVAAFEYTGQNLSRAARLLGITREALRYRLNKSMEAARESV